MTSIVDHHWFKWVHSEAFEPTLSNLDATVLSVMKRIGFERTAHVDETWIRAYAGPFPTPADCRGALAFPHRIAFLGRDEPRKGLDVLLEAFSRVRATRPQAELVVMGADRQGHPEDVHITAHGNV